MYEHSTKPDPAKKKTKIHTATKATLILLQPLIMTLWLKKLLSLNQIFIKEMNSKTAIWYAIVLNIQKEILKMII